MGRGHQKEGVDVSALVSIEDTPQEYHHSD